MSSRSKKKRARQERLSEQRLTHFVVNVMTDEQRNAMFDRVLAGPPSVASLVWEEK